MQVGYPTPENGHQIRGLEVCQRQINRKMAHQVPTSVQNQIGRFFHQRFRPKADVILERAEHKRCIGSGFGVRSPEPTWILSINVHRGDDCARKIVQRDFEEDSLRC